jgi:hypothetical protein
MLGDILLFLFVTFWVTILIYIPIIFGYVDDVKENWNDYRCSPTILPISGYINKEDNLTVSEATQQNFEYCTGAISGSFMEEMLQPITYITSGLTNLSNDILVNFQSIRELINYIREAIIFILIKVIALLANIIVALIGNTYGLLGTINKTGALVTSMANAIQSSTLTIGSAWNGQPGQFIRTVAKVV